MFQPRLIDDDECGAVETEVLGKDLLQCLFVDHKSHMT
jgi:hypothetical protein